MRHLTAIVVAVLMSSALNGCASSSGRSSKPFGTKINQIQAGTPKEVVLRELGSPDEKRSGVAGAQAVGPQPPPTVRVGSRYEQWIYRRGDTAYHVFLAPTRAEPNAWEVYAVSANPKDTSALER